MKLDTLMDCSACLLGLLIEYYKSGQLTYDEFIRNTGVKVSYLKGCIDKVKANKQVSEVMLLLEEYEQITAPDETGACTTM